MSAYTLKAHQTEPVNVLVENFTSKRGQLLIGPAGCGKTVVLAEAMRLLQEKGVLPLETEKLASIMVIAPKGTIIDNRRVFYKAGVKNFRFFSYAALRSSIGELFITWEPKMVNGELSEVPVWRPEELPDVIICDEVQNAKNSNAKCSEVLLAAVAAGVTVISASYTPFQKASETKLIATSCLGLHSNDWSSWANRISNYRSTENSPATVKRIREELEDHGNLVLIKNVRYPFPAKIENVLLDFENHVAEEYYKAAYTKYCEKRAEAKKNPLMGQAALWVAMREFREASELVRCRQLCEVALYQDSIGKQVIIASNWIPVLRKLWSTLTKEFRVSPDDISFLVGSQDMDARQKQKDLFQNGKTRFLLLTMKVGGVGLNLHHELPGSRPRHVIIPPTWSVFEYLQMLGRAHRIVSKSSTVQGVYWMRGTIEEKVKKRLDLKTYCVRELLDRRDSFMADIFNQEVDELINSKLTEDATEGEDGETEEFSFDVGMLEEN